MTVDLGTLRASYLNPDLGLASDVDTGNDARFGTKAERNRAIGKAIRGLWPRCARLAAETVTPSTGVIHYTLSTVRDVMVIERIDNDLDPARVVGDYAQYRSWVDETTPASPVTRLELVAPVDASRFSLSVIGYVPYTVPSVDADVLDIPADLVDTVTAGARANLYLSRLNAFADFERQQNTDRATTLTVEQVLTLWRAAQNEYEEGIRLHPRGATAPKTATFRRSR